MSVEAVGAKYRCNICGNEVTQPRLVVAAWSAVGRTWREANSRQLFQMLTDTDLCRTEGNSREGPYR